MFNLTALVTLLAVALYFSTSIIVARARQRTGIKAPATSGNPDFERAFRVQMNTLEWMPIFLPALWLCAYYVGDQWAAIGGLVWVIGRIMYIRGYLEEASKRGPGFGVQAFAAVLLWVSALVGIVLLLMKAH